jgi:hypothetical protein
MLGVLGIDDPWVWLAYVLCILSAVLCVVYGVARWNRDEEDVQIEDVKWVYEEKRVEGEM